MSGECDDCGWHTLECVCGTGCPCRQSNHNTHLNVVRKCMHEEKKPISLDDGIDPPAEMPPVKWVNVRGRVEHEAVIKDAAWCKELGLDQAYEVMVYLKRWGGWLGQN